MDVKGDEVEAAGRGRQAERSEATRAALIAAARLLFARDGYGGVGTEEIVRSARVTRGALYHHFASKEDLFRAVFEQVEAELTQRVAAVAASAEDPYQALSAGAETFLDACLTRPCSGSPCSTPPPSWVGSSGERSGPATGSDWSRVPSRRPWSRV